MVEGKTEDYMLSEVMKLSSLQWQNVSLKWLKIGKREENNVWSNGKRKLFTVSSWEKQETLMMEMDSNSLNKGNWSKKQKAFCLSSRTGSNTQFIRQAILHYVGSVMKRQSITHIISACSFWVKRQCRKRHDKIETYVHLLLRKKHHFQGSNKWY